MTHKRFTIGAIAFNAWTFSEALQLVLDTKDHRESSSDSRPGTAIHFANAYNIAIGETSDEYRRLLSTSDYVFIDGAPVVWAARLTRRKHAGTWVRIYGPDFMRAALAQSTQDHRHFLLGGTQQVLDRLQVAIAEAYPQAHIVGAYSPPFSEKLHQGDLDQRDWLIAKTAATHIWVGLGTPKQDYEVARLAHKHPAKCLAVGAAFDYLGGSTKEAPNILQRLGLQWVHRLVHEPRRLTKRYTWGNTVFLLSLLRNVNFKDGT